MNFDPKYDYGHSNLSNHENLIGWKFGEFLKTLITLSSSANRQFEIIGSGMVADEMAEDFYSYFNLPHKDYIDNGLINNTVLERCNELDRFLDIRSGDKAPEFWDDRNLYSNSDWKEVRARAKEILTLMGYDNFDIEFDRNEKNEMSKEGKKLVIQSTRTRLIKKTPYNE